MTASDRAKYDLPEAPRRTEALETIAPDLRSCYVEASGGGYRLSPAAEAAQDAHAETCAAIEAEASEALAATASRFAALRRSRDALLVDPALAAAALAAGVDADLVPAVTAILRRDYAFTTIEEADGTLAVRASDGLATPALAVAAFLETDAGRGYRPKASTPAGGAVSARIRALAAMRAV